MIRKFFISLFLSVMLAGTWANAGMGGSTGGSGSGNATTLQGRAVASTAPTDLQVLQWVAAQNAWQPGTVSGGGGTWGSITGTLSAQTDLNSALSGKSDTSHVHAAVDHTYTGKDVIVLRSAGDSTFDNFAGPLNTAFWTQSGSSASVSGGVATLDNTTIYTNGKYYYTGDFDISGTIDKAGNIYARVILTKQTSPTYQEDFAVENRYDQGISYITNTVTGSVLTGINNVKTWWRFARVGSTVTGYYKFSSGASWTTGPTYSYSGSVALGFRGLVGGWVHYFSNPVNAVAQTIETPFTPAAVTLNSAATTAAQRSALGLGTAAVANTGTSAGNVVVLNGSAQLPAVSGALLTNLPTTLTGVTLLSYAEGVNALGDVAGNIALNCSTSNYYTATCTADITWSITNVPSAFRGTTITIVLTNGGAYTQTWMSGIKWPGGVAPTLTASGVDILTFTTVDGGTTWRGVLAGADFR